MFVDLTIVIIFIQISVLNTLLSFVDINYDQWTQNVPFGYIPVYFGWLRKDIFHTS